MSDNHIPIRVSTLRGDNKISFNAYVKVAGKFILICREGESFEGDRLDRIKAKKMPKMYIMPEHLTPYNDYVRENIDQAYNNSQNKSLDTRVQIIHGSMQAAAEDLMDDLSSQTFYQVAIESAQRFRKFFYSESNCLQHIINLKNIDFSISHHAVSVAALSLAIAEAMGLAESRPMQLDALVVGCLLHDLEHNFNSIDFSVNPKVLTTAEKTLHSRHAIEGAKRIQDIPFYDPLVSDIINYHEETGDGSGQNAMREKDLDTFTFVAATANAFDHYLLYDNINHKDALRKILIDKLGVYPLDHMRALQKALKERMIL
jgi:response regulator RpfG family c-di-GMP phosphodiesterase